MKRMCHNCEFYTWVRRDQYAGDIGECRFNAPTADHRAVDNSHRSWNLWPRVRADAWCGKYQVRAVHD